MNTSSAKRIPRSDRRIRPAWSRISSRRRSSASSGPRNASGGPPAALEISARDPVEPAQAQVEVLAARLAVRDGLVLGRGRLAAQQRRPPVGERARVPQPPPADE
jgi:hypothetical protein